MVRNVARVSWLGPRHSSRFKALNTDDAPIYNNKDMKAILSIIAAIAFVAVFAFAEGPIILAFVALAVFAVCAKYIERHCLTDEEKNEEV